MAVHFVYILHSDKNRHYIGYTSNLEQRILQHNRKHKGFTGTTEQWEIEFAVAVEDKLTAMNLEKYLKSLKNSQKAIEYLNELVQSTSPKAIKSAKSEDLSR